MSAPTTTTTNSTNPRIPQEFLPLLQGGLSNVTSLQGVGPLQNFGQPNPQQIPGASGDETAQISRLLGFADPNGVPAPEKAALDQINFLTAGPLGSSPATTAGMDAWRRLVEPTIRQSHALQGNLGGGGFTEDESLGATAAAVPLIQQEIQNRMNVLGPLTTLGGVQRQGAQTALTAAGLPRQLTTLQNQAGYEDFLRRQVLSEQSNFGPLNTFASTMLTPQTVAETRSTGGLTGKG